MLNMHFKKEKDFMYDFENILPLLFFFFSTIEGTNIGDAGLFLPNAKRYIFFDCQAEAQRI